MTNPKLTVCIPTYNYAHFLPEAIESVLNQSFADFELVIVDDCSTDDTAAIIRDYAARDGRIRFSINQRNLGMVENWNLCLRHAGGEYIKFVFGDDLLTSPDALKKMVALMDSDSSVSLVASARKLIDPSSRVIKTESRFRKTMIMPGVDVIRRCLLEQKNLIGEPTVVMFRKKNAVRGFKENYRQLVDMEMWFYLLEQGRFAYINEPVCAFRRHPAQQTELNSRSTVPLEDTRRLLEEYLEKPYLSFGRMTRSLIAYDYCYQVWKSYRRKRLGKDEAKARISELFRFATFLLFLPGYKILKPSLKFARHLSGLMA